MKEAQVNNGPIVQIIDSPIPKAGPDQLVIKVEVCGSNPKDWKLWWVPETKLPINMGDDIAGIVHEVGEGVTEFTVSLERLSIQTATLTIRRKVGDRVFAFHPVQTPHGGWAAYAVV